MSVPLYLLVLLLCLKGISARSITKHVTLDETHLIRVTNLNYAIVFREDNYTWKVAVVNGNDVTTIDGYCMVESHKLNEDRDSELYENILLNLGSLQAQSQLSNLGYEGKQFSIELISKEGEVTVQGGSVKPADAIQVLPLTVPFSDLNAKVLVHSKFVATIDPIDRLQVRPSECITEEQRTELKSMIKAKYVDPLNPLDRPVSPFTDPLAEFMARSRSPSRMGSGSYSLSSHGVPEDLLEAGEPDYSPLDELRRELSPEEPLRDPMDTWKLLQRISQRANEGKAEDVPVSYIAIVEMMLQTLDPKGASCTPDGLALMGLKMRTLDSLGQRTDARHLMSEFTKKQYDNCIQILELGIMEHTDTFEPADIQYLVDFHGRVRDQYYDDYNISDRELTLVGKMVPTKSLYTALATFLRCKEPNLAKLTKKSSPNDAILLADAVEQHLGRKCNPLERATAIDLELYDSLMAYQGINEQSAADILDQVKAIIATSGICNAINQHNLDTNRLATAFHAEASQKLLPCLN